MVMSSCSVSSFLLRLEREREREREALGHLQYVSSLSEGKEEWGGYLLGLMQLGSLVGFSELE